MDFTFELSKIYNVMAFEIMRQDKDEVIMLLNYIAERGESSPSDHPTQNSNKQQYIKVNDRTATGGWW